jgi:hypothetical protein
MRREIRGIQCLYRFADLPVEQHAPRLDETTICHLPHAVVAEVESTVNLPQDAAPNELLETVRKLVLGYAGRVLEYPYVDVAPDHGCHIGQATGAVTEPGKRSSGQGPHTVGKIQDAIGIVCVPLAQRSRTFDHDEWISFTDRPHSV